MTMKEKLYGIKGMEAANEARLRAARLKRTEPGDKVWYGIHTNGRFCRFWFSKRDGLTVVYDMDGVIADYYKEG